MTATRRSRRHGTFGWDDDGVPAMKTKLSIRCVTGSSLARRTAAGIGLPFAIGSARAEGWQHFPIVRMVNVSLDPETTQYADLSRGMKDCLAPERRSYSLYYHRQKVHFSTQAALRHQDGELPYGAGSVPSRTPAFLGRCDGVADDWDLHGFLSCAKGIAALCASAGVAPRGSATADREVRDYPAGFGPQRREHEPEQIDGPEWQSARAYAPRRAATTTATNVRRNALDRRASLAMMRPRIRTMRVPTDAALHIRPAIAMRMGREDCRRRCRSASHSQIPPRTQRRRIRGALYADVRSALREEQQADRRGEEASSEDIACVRH